jgi:hypothetical protein
VDGAARHTGARRGQEAGVTNADADKQELLRLSAEYRRCVVQRDVEGFDRLLADDYFVIGPDGDEGSKASELELIEKNTDIEALEADEVEVRMYGEAASVTSLAWSRRGKVRADKFASPTCTPGGTDAAGRTGPGDTSGWRMEETARRSGRGRDVRSTLWATEHGRGTR